MGDIMTNDQWWDVSWNPIIGCSAISEGCQHCWASGIARRFGLPWGKPQFRPEVLDKPRHWRKIRRVFTCSISDFFHEDVPFEWRRRIVEAMTSPHVYMILTKRDPGDDIVRLAAYRPLMVYDSDIWFGVSAENQRSMDVRSSNINGRYIMSLEPLLGPVELPSSNMPRWVIIGAETGPGRRPMKLEWVERIVEQAKASNIPVFIKKLDFAGKLVKDMELWPEHLRLREWPFQ